MSITIFYSVSNSYKGIYLRANFSKDVFTPHDSYVIKESALLNNSCKASKRANQPVTLAIIRLEYFQFEAFYSCVASFVMLSNCQVEVGFGSVW